MLITPLSVDVPLQEDAHGALRVGGTRVTLEVVIAAYLRGDRPEAIVEAFDVLRLEDVYAVIAYYLSNRALVDAYITRVNAEGDAIRRQFEALPTYQPLTREMLMARLASEKGEAK
jgi:uncharacterized protein (DUF433 family)